MRIVIVRLVRKEIDPDVIAVIPSMLTRSRIRQSATLQANGSDWDY